MTRISHLPICALLLVSCGGVEGVHVSSHALSQTVDECVTPSPGLAAWYSGDNGGADSAGGGSNGGTLLEGASIVPGQVGNGIRLDGRGGGVQAPNNPSLNFGTGSFSIEAWVSVDASVDEREYLSIATKLDASGRGFTFFLRTAGEIGVQLANSREKWDNHFSSAPALRDGRFHHVAVTVDRAAGVSFYLDGLQTESAPQPFEIPTDVTNDGDLFLGRLGTALNCALAGVLDEVSIYNRVLSATEIVRDYNAGTAGTCRAARPVVPRITGGALHSLVLKRDGSLWAAGSNEYGQLGDGTNTGRNSFVEVLTGVVSVAANGNHTLALKTDGTLWATGRNAYGQLGDGTNTNRNSFARVLTGIASVASGGNHTLVVKTDGTLWAAGWNAYGQLGDGANTDRNSFVQVLTDVASAAADEAHTVAVKLDGTLWVTGSNRYGEFGDGTYTSRNTFAQVLTGVASAAAGVNFTHVLKADGTLWATGLNARGQLGGDTSTFRNTFAQVLTGVASVQANNGYALALRTDGTLWATGSNDQGQLGTSASNASQYGFVQVLTDVVRIAAGASHSLAMTTDGTVWATGSNLRGQLGSGTNIDRSTFARVAIP